MSIATEILVNGTLVPTVAAQPTHSDQYCEGGYRSVQFASDLADIEASDQLKSGMVVHVLADNSSVMWNGAAWLENGFIGDGSLDDTKLSTNSVNQLKIQTDAVTTTKILDSSIIYSKMADGAAIQFPDTEIFNANSPIVSTTISLSGDTGTTSQCLTLIHILNTSGTSVNYSFSNPDNGLPNSGVSQAQVLGGGEAWVLVVTDALCQITWIGSSAQSTVLTLQAFMR